MTQKQRQISLGLGFGGHGHNKALAKETEMSWVDRSSCFSWLQVALLTTSKSRKMIQDDTSIHVIFSRYSSIPAIIFHNLL